MTTISSKTNTSSEDQVFSRCVLKKAELSNSGKVSVHQESFLVLQLLIEKKIVLHILITFQTIIFNKFYSYFDNHTQLRSHQDDNGANFKTLTIFVDVS